MLVTTLVINVSFIGENMQCDGVYNQGLLSDDLSHLYGWYHQSASKVSGTAGYQCTQYFCDERQFLQTSDRGYETRNSTVPGPWMIPNYFPPMNNEDGTLPSPAQYYTFSSPSSVAPPASSDQYAVSEKKVAPTKKHPCYVCFKTYARPGTLKVHMRIHSGEKPYRCTYCKRAFSQSGNLAAHIRIHTGEKPYCCTTCNKSFTQSSSLKTHQKTHQRN